MKTILFILILATSSTMADASDLPPRLERQCRLAAFDQLVEWMNGREFYRISKVESVEEKVPSGQVGVRTTITFDDSKGCMNREMIVSCIPLNMEDPDSPVFIEKSLSDCKKVLLKNLRSSNPTQSTTAPLIPAPTAVTVLLPPTTTAT